MLNSASTFLRKVRVAFLNVAQALRAKRIPTWRVSTRIFDSIYIGKRPRQIVAYEKLLPEWAQWDWIPSGGVNPDAGCRLETRLTGVKLPIAKLADVPTLIDFKPFSGLSLVEGDCMPGPDLDIGTRHRLLGFLSDAKRIGFDGARREVNRSGGHFARDYGRYFVLGNWVDLNALYSLRARRWLEAGIDHV